MKYCMAKLFPDTATVSHVDTLKQESSLPLLSVIPECTPFQHLTAFLQIGINTRDIKWPYGVSVQNGTGHIYVVDSYNSRIHVVSDTGQHLNQFGHQHLSGPWGILVLGDGVFVTDFWLHALLQFSLRDLSLVKRVGKQGSGKDEFNNPRQLAVSPIGRIYVADDKNNRIQILSSDLDFKGSLQHQSMTRPVDVKFTMEELFVLSCADNPCIHIFTLSGEKLRSIISRGIHLQVSRAYFFCLDGRNNLIISDWYVDIVKVFSSEGRLLCTKGGRGHELGMFLRVGGIALFKHNSLVCVSSNNTCAIQIFSI